MSPTRHEGLGNKDKKSAQGSSSHRSPRASSLNIYTHSAYLAGGSAQEAARHGELRHNRARARSALFVPESTKSTLTAGQSGGPVTRLRGLSVPRGYRCVSNSQAGVLDAAMTIFALIKISRRPQCGGAYPLREKLRVPAIASVGPIAQSSQSFRVMRSGGANNCPCDNNVHSRRASADHVGSRLRRDR